MDFELTEDLKMVKSLAHDFVVEQLRPLERDLLGRSADLKDARAFLDDDIEQRLITIARDVGLWGASVPEEFGGGGLGVLAGCLIEEELAQTVVPFDFGDVTPILFDCNEDQQKAYLIPALNHERSACLAIVEPGSVFPDIDTKAERANGHYVLNGEKLCVARRIGEYFAIVFAASEKGATAFLVDQGTPDFEIIGGTEAATRLNDAVIFRFQDCRMAPTSILGHEGGAFSLGRKWLPSRRIIRGARALGVVQRLLEEATTRAQTWESFGRSWAERPSVQSALAEIATDIRACRLLVYEAALKADQSVPVRNEASMVKVFSSHVLRRAADRISHIYGGPHCVGDMAPDTENALSLQNEIISSELLKGLKF